MKLKYFSIKEIYMSYIDRIYLKKPKLVLIAGPKLVRAVGAYGSGIGGYTRNMEVYKRLEVPGFVFKGMHFSVRGASRNLLLNSKVIRFLSDAWRIVSDLIRHRPWATHLLGVYGDALPREIACLFLCKFLRVNFVYDIKAGVFEEEYKLRSSIYKVGIRIILKWSDLILVEGIKTKRFLENKFGLESVYYPNYILNNEFPILKSRLFTCSKLRVLFVGYCYPGKGIRELVNGCRAASSAGVPVQLTLLGAESEETSSWLNSLGGLNDFSIRRMGPQNHGVVLEAMQDADVYCYPTNHYGEGHNNSINEAMMIGLVLVVSKHGFLEDILSDETAFFLDNISDSDVSLKLIKIWFNREEALLKAASAHELLLREYSGDAAKSRLGSAYSLL